MTFAFWCIFVAMWLPLAWAGASKWGFSTYDNSRPRIWMEAQEGWRQRALWAQRNAWEAFAPFAAAVLIAHYLDADQTTVDWLAGTFVFARILHGVFYIVNKSTARSVAWGVGFIAVIGLFVASASA